VHAVIKRKKIAIHSTRLFRATIDFYKTSIANEFFYPSPGHSRHLSCSSQIEILDKESVRHIQKLLDHSGQIVGIVFGPASASLFPAVLRRDLSAADLSAYIQWRRFIRHWRIPVYKVARLASDFKTGKKSGRCILPNKKFRFGEK
jgi:hypothetical protein